MMMIDLCSGLGGSSQAMRARGWDVVTVDIDPRFMPDIVADLRTWTWDGPPPDLLWVSPPCTEFARESMPWCKTGAVPDMSIVLAARRLIADIGARYWAVENVRGAIPHLTPLFGEPRHVQLPYVLWGNFPPLGRPRLNGRKKESYSSAQRAERARIPYALSDAMATTIEGQMNFAFMAPRPEVGGGGGGG